MICVDTSIWVNAFRDRRGADARYLGQLLDADEVALAVPVRIELLSGASQVDRPKLRRTLSALPLWLPDQATWQRMEAWVQQAAEAGERFGVVDLLIGAVATEHEAAVWSHDRDFERMAALGLITAHVPSP